MLCNERLCNYICLLYVTLVLWTLLEHSYSISIYIVVHCTYIRESVNIKNCSSTVWAVRFNYSAVPEDGDLRTTKTKRSCR